MLRNYLKIAIRTILRNKTFSAINIFGLSVSLSVCIVIIMMVADQMSYDRHITDHDRIYRINTERRHSDTFINRFATSPLPLANELTENYTGIEQITRVRRGFGNGWVDFDNDINIPVGGFFAEPSFLDLFQYELLYGNPENALVEPRSVVLTKKAAEKLFEIENPIGEIIKVGELGEYKITGVLKEITHKSHIKFEALASFSTLNTLEKDSLVRSSQEDWNVSTDGWTYARLTPGTSPREVEAHLNAISTAKYKDNKEIDNRFYLQSLTAITPGPLLGNQIGPGLPDIFLYFLTGLAFIIIVSACFNYTNLSIARGLSRAKEVGIRKVSGAQKRQIFFQFISEAVIISLLALAFAFGLLAVLKPAFLSMNFSQMLAWDLNSDFTVIAICVLFSIIVGAIAGFFPALILSSFQPIKVLKDLGNIKLFSKIGFRKVLIVIQFAFSLIFIISATLVYNQLNLMVNADFGFEGDHIINVRVNDADTKLLVNEINSHSSIVNVSGSSHVPAAGISYGDEIRIHSGDEPMDFNYFEVDENYMQNLSLTLLAGKNFEAEDIKENYDKILVNETMVSKLGYTSIQEIINQSAIIADSTEVQIIGVIKDYNHEALMSEIGPMALIPAVEPNLLQVKYEVGNREAAIAHIEASWKKLLPDKKIAYEDFMTEVKAFFDMLFSDLVNIIGFITFLTITIACLGLLGMATFTTETKIKDVSIRKVLGASNKNVVIHLSKGFIILLLIATVFALPMAYYINDLWLSTMAYRVGIDLYVIGISTLVMLGLGILTISSQTIRAAFTNPAEILRSE